MSCVDYAGQSVNTTPELNLIFSAATFSLPHPDSVNEKVKTGEVIFNWGGVKIARISPDVVVKFGPHVTVTEAKSMIFVGQNARTVPVPEVFACYSYGPIDRDVDDYGSLFDTYIFMSFVEGQTLDTVWGSYDEATKHHVADQLKECLHDLRNISGGTYIGSIDRGPVTDQILTGSLNKGPFDSEESFNNTLIDVYQANAPKRHVRSLLTGMLSQNKHRTVFTHGDLRLQNIMVKSGRITGILDWEFSGWYPEYWEFSKALYVWKWQNDWIDYLMDILQPYYSEYLIHSFLSEPVW
ncbi:hypothetical protein AJ78_04484 [Emergomyces pasteurianus Ep9510]|uniref:Aminoglycoside phosphotransferase domain-containing protein n=1 Tax=Emergomyces pasteurianus Ep9510 TaxID=1447872 RepID=A0A1J9PGY1_9EURO|nr:hypothetical protein AJ78_04484 [Emergomyces pasteurianus Ep9510]